MKVVDRVTEILWRTSPQIFPDILETIALHDDKLCRSEVEYTSGYNSQYTQAALRYLQHKRQIVGPGYRHGRGWRYKLTESGRIALALIRAKRTCRSAHARATSRALLVTVVAPPIGAC